MGERDWQPGDGAEQTDSSPEAAQERVATGFCSAVDRGDEPTDGFDSAYLSWREVNGDALDSDYRRWRRESGQPFSDAFLTWARARQD